MEEIFVPLKIDKFEDFKISNFGRIMTPKGKFRTPFLDKGTLKVDIKKKKNHKIIARMENYSIAHLVYMHFSDNIPDCKFCIKYKDGNRLNVRFDNLALAIGKATPEQIDDYNNSAIKCVKHFLSHSSYWYINYIDRDNVIQESLLLIWKYLKNYNKKYQTFYNFCTKYIKIACHKEYKMRKNEIPFCDIRRFQYET